MGGLRTYYTQCRSRVKLSGKWFSLLELSDRDPPSERAQLHRGALTEARVPPERAVVGQHDLDRLVGLRRAIVLAEMRGLFANRGEDLADPPAHRPVRERLESHLARLPDA